MIKKIPFLNPELVQDEDFYRRPSAGLISFKFRSHTFRERDLEELKLQRAGSEKPEPKVDSPPMKQEEERGSSSIEARRKKRQELLRAKIKKAKKQESELKFPDLKLEERFSEKQYE